LSPLSGSETILIVDDDADVLSVMQLMLRHYGYCVITTASATEALHLFGDSKFSVDLALIDFVMPEINGVDLTQRIRLLRPKVPILYFSAFSGHEELRPALARGVPYLSKPFTAAQLARCVRDVLDGRLASAAKMK
jgi:two-component system cell cycle sensor histidine kinase/response regulator CckA